MTEPEIQKVEEMPDTQDEDLDVEAEEAAEEQPDVKDVDMEPEDHVNRPDQAGFDPAEREPYDDPDPDVLPTRDDPVE